MFAVFNYISMFSIKFSIILSFILLTFLTEVKAQSNEYFQHNENWSVIDYGYDNYDAYYISTNGETIVGEDTLVNLYVNGAFVNFGGSSFPYGSLCQPSILAKDSAQQLTLYKYDPTFTTYTDTFEVDYSRLDSISYFQKSPGFQYYKSMEIINIDTFYYNGNIRKKFFVNNECENFSDNFVYEGLFRINGEPFMDFCFESFHQLQCFGAFDSTYYSWMENPYSPSLGNCSITSLGTTSLSFENFEIYPNPVENTIHFQVRESEIGSKYTISNSLGQIMASGEILVMNNSIDISFLTSGIYSVFFDKCDGHFSSLFIKN